MERFSSDEASENNHFMIPDGVFIITDKQSEKTLLFFIEVDIKGRGVRSLKLTKCQFIPRFGEIVSSIYDLILVSFPDVLGSD